MSTWQELSGTGDFEWEDDGALSPAHLDSCACWAQLFAYMIRVRARDLQLADRSSLQSLHGLAALV